MQALVIHVPGAFFWPFFIFCFFLEKRKMWKLVLGFIVIAGLALFLLNKGGDIDLSGEKHGASPAPAAAARALV
ncbi:hypothetical protein ACEN8I_13220 [Polaromonas sp. CT11-55]|uniref:hypothetical protein n=1 Tax=Polaromonas sp. CT11-55 TaxID=3243045 RepID=UPI0039A67995